MYTYFIMYSIVMYIFYYVFYYYNELRNVCMVVSQSAALAGLYFTSPDAEDQRYVLACLDKNSAAKQSNGVTNGHTRAL